MISELTLANVGPRARFAGVYRDSQLHRIGAPEIIRPGGSREFWAQGRLLAVLGTPPAPSRPSRGRGAGA